MFIFYNISVLIIILKRELARGCTFATFANGLQPSLAEHCQDLLEHNGTIDQSALKKEFFHHFPSFSNCGKLWNSGPLRTGAKNPPFVMLSCIDFHIFLWLSLWAKNSLFLSQSFQILWEYTLLIAEPYDYRAGKYPQKHFSTRATATDNDWSSYRNQNHFCRNWPSCEGNWTIFIHGSFKIDLRHFLCSGVQIPIRAGDIARDAT